MHYNNHRYMVFILISDKNENNNYCLIKNSKILTKTPELSLSNHLLTTIASTYLASSSLCHREITVELSFYFRPNHNGTLKLCLLISQNFSPDLNNSLFFLAFLFPSLLEHHG